MKGIDVSKHQGKIDWQKVKAAGVEFSIVRAGYGMYENQVDSRFAENMVGAKAAGIPVGVYWYSYAVSISEAIREAEVCLKIIEPYQSQIVLPVFFDQEYEPGILALDNQTRTEICLNFIERIQKQGYRGGLYCSWDFWKNKLNNSLLSQIPLWIAQYADVCSYHGSNLIAWQYSSSGKVDGIIGNVDLNCGYDGLMNSPVKDGWTCIDAKWYYYHQGIPVKDQWICSDGWRYRLGPDGIMLTGLQEIEGKVYCFNAQRSTVGNIYVPEGACVITNEKGEIISK